MNTVVLIDLVVHQTMVLIAQLATSAGRRTPLSNLAEQVFDDLVGALRQQGVGAKVIADMFGMALSTYHARRRRLAAGKTQSDRSLWEAVWAHLHAKRTASQAEVLIAFSDDDESTVRAVLHDLVDSGLAYRSGRGNEAMYRARDEFEGRSEADEEWETWSLLTLLTVNRLKEPTRDTVAEELRVDVERVAPILDRLEAENRIRAIPVEGGEPVYGAPTAVIPLGHAEGWEIGLFDHFRAMVSAMVQKLDGGSHSSAAKDRVGGSTYGFELWDGHPYAVEVESLLDETRKRISALRTQVDTYNDAGSGGARGRRRVTFYFGQGIQLEDEASPTVKEEH